MRKHYPYTVICDKCKQKRPRPKTHAAYTNADGWVRLCWECANQEFRKGAYKFPSHVRRAFGESVAKAIRA